MELLALLGYFIYTYSILDLYKAASMMPQKDELNCSKYFNHIKKGREKVYMFSQISERTEAT